MVDVTGATLLSVLVVSLISLVGAATLSFGALRRHIVLLGLVAVAAGTLLGDSFFHLLPEAVEFRGGFPLGMGVLVILGFLAFFGLETGLRWGHAHGEVGHQPEHVHPEGHQAAAKIAPFAWLNLAGDGVHNFVDGALIATAYAVDPTMVTGVATTVAVAAHEIPQEFGDFAVLLSAGVTPGRALLYNLLSALLAALGAAAILVAPLSGETLEFYAVPLIAGGFLYIAAADLVPELHHHSERRYVPIIVGGFLLGIASMILLLRLEL